MMREPRARRLREQQQEEIPMSAVNGTEVVAEAQPDGQTEAAPAPEPRERARFVESPVIKEMKLNEDKALKEWLEEINPGAAIRVKIERKKPTIWKGKNVGGVVGNYEHTVDEEFIRETHGGGDYYLVVQRPRASGSGWQYAGGKMIKIAGDPRLDDVYRDGADQPAAPNSPNAGIVERALGSLERQLEKAQQQQQPSHGGGIDGELLRQVTGPMQQQMAEMHRTNRDLQAQLAMTQQAAQKPPERDEFRDKMLDKLLDGDSARITALRTQYESELRMAKEHAHQSEERLHDRFERDRQAATLMHEREIGMLRQSYDLRVASVETAASTTRSLLEAEVRRLEAQLGETKAEVVALRLKKDKTILEQASEFAAIKDALGEITGDDKNEKSGWEKALEVAGNLPVMQTIAQKFAGGEQGPSPQQVAQAQAQQVAQHRPKMVQGPDGNLYRTLPGGKVELVRKRSAPPPTADGTGAVLPEISATTIKVSVDYLENAYRNNHDPEAVATSVRSMIPAEVMTAIKSLGIEKFLTDVAKVDAESPLSSQGGRNWARKLGKALIGES
jgi:hypothetical protein